MMCRDNLSRKEWRERVRSRREGQKLALKGKETSISRDMWLAGVRLFLVVYRRDLCSARNVEMLETMGLRVTTR